jgi:hypothetical protein
MRHAIRDSVMVYIEYKFIYVVNVKHQKMPYDMPQFITMIVNSNFVFDLMMAINGRKNCRLNKYHMICAQKTETVHLI